MLINLKNDNPQFNDTAALQPARVTDKSKTLINSIFRNSFEFITLFGNITHSISDHLLQLIIIKDFVTPKPSSKSNM